MASLCWSAITELTTNQKNIFQETTLAVTSTMVAAHLDYWNSIVYGTSNFNIQKLHCIQYWLVKIVMDTRRIDHITPVFARLQWLPLAMHIEYKVALLIFKESYHYTAP